MSPDQEMAIQSGQLSDDDAGQLEQVALLLSEEAETGAQSRFRRAISAALVVGLTIGVYVLFAPSGSRPSNKMGDDTVEFYDDDVSNPSHTISGSKFCRENPTYGTCDASQCFPGEAVAYMREIGRVPMASLRVGDEVLVENGLFEPILAFLHVVRSGSHGYNAVQHERGQFRATGNHVVFIKNESGERTSKAVSSLAIGDEIFVATGDISDGTTTSMVTRVHAESTDAGMYAPLTMSGTIVVDGVIASNYANAKEINLPHSVMHAVLFPVRMYHKLGFAAWFAPAWKTKDEQSELHPFVIPFMKLFVPSGSMR